jgi:hypothetical protein
MFVKTPKSYSNVTGLMASKNRDRLCAFESTLERDFFLTLEFSSGVSSYQEQPLAIEWRDTDNRFHAYTPDALVTFSARDYPSVAKPWLVEIKYRRILRKDWSLWKLPFKAAVRTAALNGWIFKIITEDDVRTPFLDNARFLRQFLKLNPPHETSSLFLCLLEELQVSTPEELLRLASGSGKDPVQLTPTLWHLIATRTIVVDLAVPLTLHSPVSARGDP